MGDRNTPTTYELSPGDAGLAADILLRLADLCDGGTDRLTTENRLYETQLQLMSKPATVYSRDPDRLARRLREVSAAIEKQLPLNAPRIEH